MKIEHVNEEKFIANQHADESETQKNNDKLTSNILEAQENDNNIKGANKFEGSNKLAPQKDDNNKVSDELVSQKDDNNKGSDELVSQKDDNNNITSSNNDTLNNKNVNNNDDANVSEQPNEEFISKKSDDITQSITINQITDQETSKNLNRINALTSKVKTLENTISLINQGLHNQQK